MPQAIVPPELDAYVTDWRMYPGLEHDGFVFMTGFTGAGADGAMPNDPEAQMRAAFAKVGQVLTEAGLGFEHIVEMMSYHVELRDHLDLFKRIRAEHVAEPFPAWTAIEVVGVVREGAIIELRIIARRS